jgi:4-amino-4-deoxy-L-arabinose transferase-like glycosyltransferase
VQRNEWSLLSNVLLALFATLAFWETVAVDLLHCTHCMVEKFREGIWGSMAVTLVGYSFIMAKRDSSGVMTVFFLLFGMFCAAIAALDARVEYRRRKYPCSSASSPRSTLPS